MCVGRCRGCSLFVRWWCTERFFFFLPLSGRQSPPSDLRGSGLEKRAPGREGGTESAEVARSAVQGTAVSVLRSAFVRKGREPKERQGRDCMRSVCHWLGEKLNLRVSRRSAEGVTEPECRVRILLYRNDKWEAAICFERNWLLCESVIDFMKRSSTGSTCV